MKVFLAILFFIFLFYNSLSIQNDMPAIRGCPQIKLMPVNFSLDAMSGTWYEISKHASSSKSGSCISINVTPSEDGRVLFTYSQKFTDDVRKESSISYFNASVISSSVWSCTFKSLYGNHFCHRCLLLLNK